MCMQNGLMSFLYDHLCFYLFIFQFSTRLCFYLPDVIIFTFFFFFPLALCTAPDTIKSLVNKLVTSFFYLFFFLKWQVKLQRQGMGAFTCQFCDAFASRSQQKLSLLSCSVGSKPAAECGTFTTCQTPLGEAVLTLEKCSWLDIRGGKGCFTM